MSNDINDIFELHRIEPVNVKYLSRLERAIFTGDNRTVKSLIKEDANKRNRRYGFNAFQYAIELGDINIVRELVARTKSVDMSLVNDKGRNCLMIAVIHGSMDIMQFLLQEVNVKIGYQDNNGHTALNFAVFTRNVKAVKLLMDKGEDVNHVDKYGKFIIHYAIINNSVDIVQILKDNVDLSIKDYDNASIQDYLKGKKELEVLLYHSNDEDESSDIVTFDTLDSKEIQQDNIKHVVERLGASLNDENTGMTDNLSIKLDNLVMDASFFTADQLSTTSDYIMMDYPILRQNSTTQTDLNLSECLKQIENLEGAITQEQNIREDLIQEKNELVKKVSEIQDSFGKIETREMDILSEGLVSKNASLKMYEIEVRDLNQELEKVSRRNSELEKQVLQALNQKEEFLSKISDLNNLQKSVKELEDKSSLLEKRNMELEITITGLEIELEKANYSLLDNEEEELKIIHLQNLLNQSQSEKDELLNVVSMLRTEITDLNGFKKQMNDKLIHQTMQSESCRKEIEGLIISNERAVLENNDLRIELAKVLEKTATAELNVLSIPDQSENEKELQNVIRQLETDIKTLKIAEKQMQDKLQHGSAQAESYKREIDNFLISNEAQLRENDELRVELRKATEEKEANQVSKSRIIELEGMLNQSDIVRNELQDGVDQLKVKIEDLTYSQHELQDKARNDTIKAEEHQKEFERLFVEKRNTEQEVEKLHTEMRKIKSNGDLAIKDLVTIQDRLESEKKELCTQIAHLKEELNIAYDELSNKSSEYEMWKKSCQKETENLQRLIQVYIHDMDEIRLDRDKLIVAREERNAGIIDMENSLNQSNQENQKLKNTIKDLTHEMNNLTFSYQELSDKLGKDSIQAQSYLTEIEKLKNSNEKYIGEIDFLREKVSKFQKEIKEMKIDKSKYKKDESLPASAAGPKTIPDLIVESEIFKVREINNRQLEEIQRLRLDLLSSLKCMDSKLDGLPISLDHVRSPSRDQLHYPFINAAQNFNGIKTKLLSPKVGLIYERRKLE